MLSRNTRRRLLALLTTALLLIPTIPLSAITLTAHAAPGDLIVTNGNDNGPGSLRAAVVAAAVGDIITFASNVTTVTLTSDEIKITVPNLTIDGGVGVTVQRSDAAGTPAFRIINCTADALTLKKLTIKNGNAQEGYGGGAYVNEIIAVKCTFVANEAAYGGGMYVGQSGAGFAGLLDCSFAGNTASSGGAVSGKGIGMIGPTIPGIMIMTNCTVSGNTTKNANAAAIISPNLAFLAHVTVTNNKGGGIWALGPPFEMPRQALLYNCIVTGNTDTTGTVLLQTGGGGVVAESSLVEGENGVTHAQVFGSNIFDSAAGVHRVLWDGIAAGTATALDLNSTPTGAIFGAPEFAIYNDVLAADQLGAPRATTGAVTYGAVEAVTPTSIVFFDPDGGNDIAPIAVTVGAAYGPLPTPVRTGYNFVGWFTQATGGTQITEASIVASATNHTLYARWTAVSNPVKTIFGTKYEQTPWNWFRFIVLFGWVWMWF